MVYGFPKGMKSVTLASQSRCFSTNYIRLKTDKCKCVCNEKDASVNHINEYKEQTEKI